MEIGSDLKANDKASFWWHKSTPSGFSKVVIGVAVGAAFSGIGSGGSAYVQSVTIESPKFSVDDIYNSAVFSEGIDSLEKNKTTKQIDYIKETFALTDEKLADLLAIQRKTLHNWKEKDHIPREDSRQRFFQLYVLARDWVALGFPTNKYLSDPYIPEYQRLLEAFRAIDRDKALFIGRHIQRQLEESDLM